MYILYMCAAIQYMCVLYIKGIFEIRNLLIPAFLQQIFKYVACKKSSKCFPKT